LIFFLNFIPQYLFVEESCFFVFPGLLLMGSPRPHDPGHRSKRLARVNFDLFKSIFYKKNKINWTVKLKKKGKNFKKKSKE